jgi:hypothetical protein
VNIPGWGSLTAIVHNYDFFIPPENIEDFYRIVLLILEEVGFF